LTLVVDIEEDPIVMLKSFGRGELGLSSEKGVLGIKAEKPHRRYDSVLEVRFHLDVSTLADLSLLFAIANYTRSLPEIGFIGNYFDATSFSDGNLAFISTQIDTDWGWLKLL
jgi:hypothetical protein